MRECIDVMEQAFTDLERGFISQPLRAFWAPPGVKGGTMWMAAHRSAPKPMFGTKLLFVLQDNPSRGLRWFSPMVRRASCARCSTHPP